MKLYHYTKSDAVIKILMSEKIKFSFIKDFNDPFEFQFTCKSKNPEQEKKDHKELYDNFIKFSAVFSLSKEPNDILMLSHYADKHKGWFIEFEFNENPSNKNIAAAHISYDKPIPDMREFVTKLNRALSLKRDANQFMEEFIRNGGVGDFTKKYADASIFGIVARKHMDWEYEEETRLLLSKVGDKLCYDDLFLTLQECGLEIKAVYEGCRVSKQDREIVEKIIKTKNQHIEMKKAISNDSYKIDNRVF